MSSVYKYLLRECNGVGRMVAGRVVVSGGRDVLLNVQWRGSAVLLLKLIWMNARR